ncbi:2-hydroxyacid dehydrogenase [Paenibacillus nasutitermitis]|nr:D-glycerate dehydrogenase [Paenibacillus nasutitermitis]
MMKPGIFIDRRIPAEVEAYLAEHCVIDKWEHTDPIPRETLLSRIGEAEGLLTSGTKINNELLEHAPGLKVVSSISVGYNHFDIPAMKQRGVIGTNTPDVLNDTVADLVFALILGSARRVAELDHYVKEGLWKPENGEKWFGTDVHHATLGIIGMGRIGETIARRAKYGFDMDVIYHNRSRKPEAEEQLGVRYESMDKLLSESDFIVLMAPLTPQTEGLIGRSEFNLMKKTAIFINASRGQTVDEQALIEALKEGVISGAGLDVYQKEPVDVSNPLLQMPNVLTLPHIGSATAKTRFEMAMLAARNLVAALQGGTPPQLLNEFK